MVSDSYKANHPVSNETWYFVDKCLPFGSSISCTIFQAISDAIAYIIAWKAEKPNVNYLDDYLFIAAFKIECDKQLRLFLQVCDNINIPVALEKTFWGTTLLTFLGLLLDTENQIVCLLVDKVLKALDLVDSFINKRNRRATLLQFHKLCGSLNFLCKCIVPGRTFLRRLYPKVGKLKQHHHIRITQENRLDLITWRYFLRHSLIYSRPLTQASILDAQVLDMCSDASRNFKLGSGAYCGQE